MKFHYIKLLQFGTVLIFLIFPIMNMIKTKAIEWKLIKILFIVIYALSSIHLINLRNRKFLLLSFLMVILSISFFIHFCNVGNLMLYLFPISYAPYALGVTIYSIYGQIILFSFVTNYIIVYLNDSKLAIELMPHFIFIIMMMFSMDYFAKVSRKQYEINIMNEKLALLSSQFERNRISQDLHDSLGQDFSTLTVKSELAIQLLEQDTELAKKEMIEIQTLSQNALFRVRNIIEDIKCSSIEDEINYIKNLLNDAGIESNIELNYENINELQQHEISMLIKELINNVLKHSNASKVLINILQDIHKIRIVVEDNGRGINKGDQLKSVEARVHNMNGKLLLKSVNPGLRVVVDIEVNK